MFGSFVWLGLDNCCKEIVEIWMPIVPIYVIVISIYSLFVCSALIMFAVTGAEHMLAQRHQKCWCKEGWIKYLSIT